MATQLLDGKRQIARSARQEAWRRVVEQPLVLWGTMVAKKVVWRSPGRLVASRRHMLATSNLSRRRGYRHLCGLPPKPWRAPAPLRCSCGGASSSSPASRCTSAGSSSTPNDGARPLIHRARHTYAALPCLEGVILACSSSSICAPDGGGGGLVGSGPV